MRAPCGVKAFRELRGGIVVGPGSGSGTVVRGHFPFRFLRATHGHARLLDGFEPPVAHQVGQRAFVGHDTMHRGPPGTLAHRSHATTDA